MASSVTVDTVAFPYCSSEMMMVDWSSCVLLASIEMINRTFMLKDSLPWGLVEWMSTEEVPDCILVNY